MAKQIAIRFYENTKFGSTYGKGKYHKAVLNATADITNPKVKYLLDMYSFEDWANTAISDTDMDILNTAIDVVADNADDYLATWVARLDSSQSKPRVSGFGLLNTTTSEFTLLINDEDSAVEDAWRLTAKPCRAVIGKNSPQLLASNTDLAA